MDVQKKHSGLGLASFILSIFSLVALFAALIVFGVIEAQNPGGLDEESPVFIALGLAIILFFVLSIVAFGLSIAGLFQKERKKVFAVVGLILSALTVLVIVLLMAIGIAAG